MTNRFLLGLLLALVLLAPVRIATAQLKPIPLANASPPLPRQSHHDLPGGLDLDNPQEMMIQRLHELRELHQLQDQVQELLADPEVLASLLQLSNPELRQLREKLLQSEGLPTEQRWNDLLQQAGVQKKLDRRQIDRLRRWAKLTAHNLPSPPQDGPLLEDPGSVAGLSSPSSGTLPSLPPPEVPKPSLFDQLQQESTQWMIEHLDDVGGDMLEALNEVGMTAEGAPLAEFLRQQPDFSTLNVGESAMGLSQYLTNVGEFLHERRGVWEGVHSLFRDVPLPSLPGLAASSATAPVSAAADGEDGVPALLALLMLGLIVLLGCKMAMRSQARGKSSEAESWRLGPWPVAPAAVATRQEVVHAFEYLVLLCLGPAAACHHRQLAERLAEQDSGNPARRQAAEMLAWLYEQARYAPASESLSHDQLSDARLALCFLAGVTTA